MTDMRERVSAEEWQVRTELAACYRLMAKFKMTDLIYNHITARVPGPEHHVLINPFGLLYEEITASGLIKITLEGEVVLKSDLPYGVNRAGYVIHSAVHGARPDVRCVIHTHTRAGVAVSTMSEGLLPVTQNALRFYEGIGYHDYEGPAIDADERKRLVESLGQKDVLILRNHGLLVCGRSIGEAFHLMQRLETACQIQVDLMAAGAQIHWPSEESQKRTGALFYRDSKERGVSVGGALEWAAVRRLLDRDDPSYKD